MAQSRNNPVGETEREEEQREREREGERSRGNSLSARSLLLSMELRYLLHMCVGTSDKSTHPLPHSLWSSSPFLTLLHICPALFCPLVPRCAQMKRNRTNGLSAFWRVTPPWLRPRPAPPQYPVRTRRPCPKCKLIACTN